MNVALIPVRGGSKSIPLKNIAPMLGKPLVYWTINAAQQSTFIEKIFVSTDSPKIKETVISMGFSKVEIFDRSKESASDTASTESAMIEFAESKEFDNIILIQATSPLLTTEDINNGFSTFMNDGVDSVLSVVRQKRFIWECSTHGAVPKNYDFFHRPRRQEFQGFFVENGAFYITSRSRLLATKSRVSGNIQMVEMAEEAYFEIDEPADWIIVESLLQKRENQNKPSLQKNIRLFVSDVDGVMTDGGMYYSEMGDESKKFNTKDGMGFELLKKNGVKIGIISGETGNLLRRRAQKLNLDICILGEKNKLAALKNALIPLGIDLSEVAYIGDDINDLELLKSVGMSFCPSDSISLIKENVKKILISGGGMGAVREAAEHIIKKLAVGQ